MITNASDQRLLVTAQTGLIAVMGKLSLPTSSIWVD